DPLGTDPRPDRGNLLVDDVSGGPGWLDPGYLGKEPGEDLLSVRRVRHLWVELHTGQAPRTVLERGHRSTRRPGRDGEPRRGRGHAVAVAHPHRLLGGQAIEQYPRIRRDPQRRPAELALPGVHDLATEHPRHRLEPVADTENRHSGVEQ